MQYIYSLISAALTLDGRDIHPETGVISEILLITVDLLLNPLNCGFVGWLKVSVFQQETFSNRLTIDVIGVGVVKATRPVAVSCAPSGISVVLLTLMASSDISGKVSAVYRYLLSR